MYLFNDFSQKEEFFLHAFLQRMILVCPEEKINNVKGCVNKINNLRLTSLLWLVCLTTIVVLLEFFLETYQITTSSINNNMIVSIFKKCFHVNKIKLFPSSTLKGNNFTLRAMSTSALVDNYLSYLFNVKSNSKTFSLHLQCDSWIWVSFTWFNCITVVWL